MIDQSLYIHVDDVDAHHRNPVAAGAATMDMFRGDRMYTVTDPEGHRWSFAQHTRDIAPEDMKPPLP